MCYYIVVKEIYTNCAHKNEIVLRQLQLFIQDIRRIIKDYKNYRKSEISTR